jgi:hypothetical protein
VRATRRCGRSAMTTRSPPGAPDSSPFVGNIGPVHSIGR